MGKENPVLLKGEIGYEEETGKYKIGDGLSAWNDLDYSLNFFKELLLEDLTKITNVLNITKDSFNFGKENTVETVYNEDLSDLESALSYCFGYDNINKSKHSFVTGKSNINNGNDSFITSCFNENEGKNCLIAGY